MITPDEVLGVVYLLVSASSAIAQGRAMREMAKDESVGSERIHRHLVRTVTWRFSLQVVYVGVAIVSLIFEPIVFKVVALVVFTTAQLVWRANTRADVKLRRELAMTAPYKPRVAGKLGRKPYDNTRPNIVLTRRHFPRLGATPDAPRNALPPVPPNIHRLIQNDYPMYLNDQLGICFWAMVGHAIQTYSLLGMGTEQHPTDTAILHAYEKATGYNPNDPSTDQGTNMQEGLEYWRKTGIVLPDGTVDRIVAFAEVQRGDYELFTEAVATLGLTMIGIQCPQSAQDQFEANEPWTVVKGSPVEGGHAILGGGYSSNTDETEHVTWAHVQKMEQDFFTKYVDEIWVVFTEKWIKNNATPDGFNLQELAADFTVLTGERFPDEPTPSPTPPSPTPSPAIPGWDNFVQDAKDWLKHRHTGVNQTFARNVLEFLEANGQ